MMLFRAGRFGEVSPAATPGQEAKFFILWESRSRYVEVLLATDECARVLTAEACLPFGHRREKPACVLATDVCVDGVGQNTACCG